MGTIFYLASERSERDTLRSVQLRIADIYIAYYMSKSGIWLVISGVVSYFHEPKASAIQLTSEITWPYSTTSVISGLFYTSYSPVVSQDASILARISGSQ